MRYTLINYFLTSRNMKTTTTAPETFESVFRSRIEKLEAEARASGLNFTTICREAGISRATPDRWKRATPKTVRIVTTMEEIVQRHKAAVAAAVRR